MCLYSAYFGLSTVLVPGSVSLQIQPAPHLLQLIDQLFVLGGTQEDEIEVVQNLHLFRLSQPVIFCRIT